MKKPPVFPGGKAVGGYFNYTKRSASKSSQEETSKKKSPKPDSLKIRRALLAL